MMGTRLNARPLQQQQQHQQQRQQVIAGTL
jgi:hypothetical protein